MTIRLEVFLPFRGRRMWRGEEQVAAGTTVGALLAALLFDESELTVLVNGRHAGDEQVLAPGDEVSVLRPVEGGAGGA